jgi:hypothetical protein
MPLLRFHGVYLLTTPPGELRGADLAIGVRQRDDVPNPRAGGKKHVYLEWLSVNGSGMGGHAIQGIPLREGDSLEIQVTSWEGWTKAPPSVFRFEPLTHALFTKMGLAGWVTNYKQFADRLPDDAAVRNYFFSLYMADGWEETPE